MCCSGVRQEGETPARTFVARDEGAGARVDAALHAPTFHAERANEAQPQHVKPA